MKSYFLKKYFPLFKNHSAGFTFVEILITLAIFSILITAALGIFSYSLRIQKHALASQQLLDQTSYVMEYMGRTIRMAKKDDPSDSSNPTGCVGTRANYDPTDSSSATSLSFIKAEVFESTKAKQCVTFYLNSGKLWQRVGTLQTQLMPNNIEITSFKFHISGGSQPPADNYQPRITIFLSAKIKDMSDSPVIKLQTTISQRDIDVEEK